MAGVVLAAALAVSGCSGDEPEPEPTPSTSETTDPEAEATAQITAAYYEWWDAVVEATNTGTLEPGPFQDIATSLAIDKQLLVVRRLADQGITRQGEPEIFQPAVTTLDGDTARIEGCVDEASWKLIQNDEELPADSRGPTPRVLDFVRQDGAWIVADTVPQQEATITC